MFRFRTKAAAALSLTLALSVPTGDALASAAVLLAGKLQRDAQLEEEVLMQGKNFLPYYNDGFIEAAHFYKVGPAFRICYLTEGMQVRVENQKCVERVRDDTFRKEYAEKDGIPPQDFLDKHYGKGVTEFVGIAGRPTREGQLLVIYYRLR